MIFKVIQSKPLLWICVHDSSNDVFALVKMEVELQVQMEVEMEFKIKVETQVEETSKVNVEWNAKGF